MNNPQNLLNKDAHLARLAQSVLLAEMRVRHARKAVLLAIDPTTTMPPGLDPNTFATDARPTNAGRIDRCTPAIPILTSHKRSPADKPVRSRTAIHMKACTERLHPVLAVLRRSWQPN